MTGMHPRRCPRARRAPAARQARRAFARAAIALALGVTLAATGCSGGPASPSTSSGAPGGGSSVAATRSTPGTPTSPPPQAVPADVAHLALGLARVVSGLDHPVYVTGAHDSSDRLFVVEQPGRIRVVRSGKVVAGSFLDVTSQVSYGGERGLLGLAFSPGFSSNGRFYVDYTDSNGDTRIVRYTADTPASDHPHLTAQTVLRIAQPYPNHNGGCLQFGPDGYLWIGMGDGGSAGDPGNRAQNPRVLLGKMLRIDVDGATSGTPYAIPPGQPARAGWAPEVWAIGLRNPWRFSFDASSGALWMGDVGQDAWEEIDVVPSPAKPDGLNFGWPFWEGLHAYRNNPGRAGFTFPIYDYPHPTGESITGGYVYRGLREPALLGTYVFADFVKGWVGVLRATAPDGTPLPKVEASIALRNVGSPSSFGLDDDGELYLVDYGGTIYRVTARAK